MYVGPSRYEAKVSRLVSSIVVNSIQLEFRDVPTWECDEVSEEICATVAPVAVDGYSSPAVVFIPLVVRVEASVVDRADSIEQPFSVIVVWEYVDVSQVLLLCSCGFFLCACVTSCRRAFSQVMRGNF